jgi:hypothetical protein
MAVMYITPTLQQVEQRSWSFLKSGVVDLYLLRFSSKGTDVAAEQLKLLRHIQEGISPILGPEVGHYYCQISWFSLIPVWKCRDGIFSIHRAYNCARIPTDIRYQVESMPLNL